MSWRPLTAREIEQLTAQNNSADNWNQVSVAGIFCVDSVRNCHFSGRIFIGENVVLQNVGVISNYHIANGCCLHNVQELSYTQYGFNFPISVGNEDGSHTFAASPEMCVADAFLSAYAAPSNPLHQMATQSAELSQLTYGQLQENVQIWNTGTVRDCYFEPNASISGCTALRNVYVHSSAEAMTQLGDGVILQNVILGKGNCIDSHTIARNVLTGDQVCLSDGLRISHCVVGDNSHLSCCEVLHALLFPFHEQHHNSSFLIAACLHGQSNIASGATLGSNHNGRKNDCAFVAGRGFWAGLCTSIKFPSRLASYTLLSKGDYPYEINLQLPFSLLNNNVYDNVLEVMPAYWWMYNAYALRRNADKFKQRDQRLNPTQHVQYQPIAPDTVQEILYALNKFYQGGQSLTDGLENSKRTVRILKKDEAFSAYREMLLFYVWNTLHADFAQDERTLFQQVKKAEGFQWTCLGGQLLRTTDVQTLCQQPSCSWTEMHQRYDQLQLQYEVHNKSYAAYVLKYLCDCKPSAEKVAMLMEQGSEVVQDFNRRADAERQRDLCSPFRQSTIIHFEN